jgi:hypothetical protein
LEAQGRLDCLAEAAVQKHLVRGHAVAFRRFRVRRYLYQALDDGPAVVGRFPDKLRYTFNRAISGLGGGVGEPGGSGIYRHFDPFSDTLPNCQKGRKGVTFCQSENSLPDP